MIELRSRPGDGRNSCDSTGVDLFTVFIETHSRWRSTITPASNRPYPDHVSVDGTRDTVMDLHVEFRKNVFRVNGGVTQITNGSGLNHVADGKSLDGLVLWYATGTVRTPYRFDMPAARFIASTVSSFFRHLEVEVLMDRLVMVRG